MATNQPVVAWPSVAAARLDGRMRYTLAVERDTIVVRHSDDLAVEAIEASRRVVAGLMAAGNSRVLLDLSAATTYSLTTLDIYGLCGGQGPALPSGASIAVVYRPDQIPSEGARFPETVGLNRGVTLRTFTDLVTARQWLSSSGGAGSLSSRLPSRPIR